MKLNHNMFLKIKILDVSLLGFFLLMNAVFTFLGPIYTPVGYVMFLTGVCILLFFIIFKFRLQCQNRMLIWYIIFWFIMLISLLYSSTPSDGFSTIVYVGLFHIPVIMSCFMFCQNENNIDKLIICYVLASIILSVIVLKDGPIGIKNVRYGWSTTGGQPNTPALNLGAAVAFCLYLLKKEKSIIKKIIYILFMILFSATIFLTGSRKILIYIAGIFIMDSLYSSKNMRKNMLKIFTVLVIFFFAYIILTQNSVMYHTIGSRIFTNLSQEESSSERAVLRQGAWRYFLSSPLIGNGIDTYKNVNTYHLYAHNNFLELLCGVGIIGTLLYYSFFVFITIKLWHARQNKLNLLFASVMIMTIIIEWYNVNYLQRGVFFVYALAYCQYSIEQRQKNNIGTKQEPLYDRTFEFEQRTF